MAKGFKNYFFYIYFASEKSNKYILENALRSEGKYDVGTLPYPSYLQGRRNV